MEMQLVLGKFNMCRELSMYGTELWSVRPCEHRAYHGRPPRMWTRYDDPVDVFL